MARYEMELRNLPRQRIMEYLVEAGGTRPNPDALRVQGDGWAAWLEELPPAQITVMTIRRDRLVIEGDDDDATAAVHAHMRQRTMRGGG